jgi:hypothetical protein
VALSQRLLAVNLPSVLGGGGKIVVSYYSNFHGQGEVLTISKRQPGVTKISPMSNNQRPSGAPIWGKSQGSGKRPATWTALIGVTWSGVIDSVTQNPPRLE